MRQTTRRKTYAKAAAAGALRVAIMDLKTAIAEAGKTQPNTPLYDAIQGAAAALKRAADSFDVYNLQRKRLQQELRKEMVHLEGLLQQLLNTPITKEEKLVAKVSKKKGR